jgi:hypothetical protein
MFSLIPSIGDEEMSKIKIGSVILAIVISILPFGWLDPKISIAQTERVEQTNDDRPEQSVLDVFTNLLSAIATNDYKKFVAEGNSGFQEAITKEMFEPVSKELASRLNAGYTTVFLGELQQQGYRVYVWKVTFKDGGDDFLARLSLQDGKVGGFWLN